MIPGAERLTVRRDGLGLATWVAGPIGAPVIVCIHGYPNTAAIWVPIMVALCDRYRVVAYDVRGAGASDTPTGRRAWDLTELRADLLAVVDTVSPDAPVHLVGHDWGSVQAWDFVADPEAATRIASFTSIAGPSLDHVRPWTAQALRSPRRLAQVARQALHSAYIGFFSIPLAPELFWKLLWRPVSVGLLAESRVEAPRDHVPVTFCTDARNGLALYRQNAMRRFLRPRRDAISPIAVPVQLVVPRRDRFLTPAVYADVADHVQTLVRRDLDAGHWVPLTHPDRLAGWIDEFVTWAEHPTDPAPRALRRASAGPDRRPFEDRVVVITGAARGIGRATAMSFAERGATLVLSDLDKPGLDRTAELATLCGAPEVHVHEVDVSDRRAVDAFAEAVVSELGAPDVVVNNAGVGAAGPFLATPPEEWERVLGINLGGVVNGCAAFAPSMVASGEGGSIVNLASAAAYLPSKATPVYGTSKAAVLAFSENLRAELAGTGVVVSAVCPGVVDTPIVADTHFCGTDDAEVVRDALVELYRRRGFPPERVAEAIVGAVLSGQAVVPVTPEARAGLLAARLAPWLVRRMARLDPTATARRLRAGRRGGRKTEGSPS